MIEPSRFFEMLSAENADFFTGVPDSLLKPFCRYLADNLDGTSHITAANEGCAIGLAAGHHLATGHVPVVYMQNSGIGNAVNPLLSLADGDVYRIPMVLVIGWRGEPGTKDEPQHSKQGKVTCSILETMGIGYEVMSDDEDELAKQVKECAAYLRQHSSPYAFVVRKGTFTDDAGKQDYDDRPMSREDAISSIVGSSGKNDIFISTTGMASRELYEIRTNSGTGIGNDFLTVGSMGHASQIATAIALRKPNRKVFCLDGDGAVIMHMGGMSTIGTLSPNNMVHIVLNNRAHDSVGGQPTSGPKIDLPKIAEAMGYREVYSTASADDLKKILGSIEKGPVFIEVNVRKGSRKDLGRPKETPQENKTAFMRHLEGSE